MFQRTIRWVLLCALIGLVWPAMPVAALYQEGSDDRYEDPDGRFSVPVPSGWTAEDADSYGFLTGPGGDITIAVLALEADGPAAGIAAAWEIVDPDFSLEPIQEQTVPPPAGADDAVVITYDMGQDTGEVVQAIAQVADGVVYVLLIRGDRIAAEQRTSQVNVIASGLEIAGVEEVDLSSAEPLAVEGEVVESLESYLVDTMEQFDVPGATIAIVQGGEVIYREAFGVTELGSDQPMEPQTRMMIGSTTKSMTTMMLATLVDEGVIDWETPVVDILPSFSVADPELTSQITVQDLVCACTGVPRRDLELIFNAEELTAQDIVDSLAEFEFFTPIGEAFQYSNQMVATGGYSGAVAVHGEDADLYDAYVDEMMDRVLGPIDMERSTFSFEEVIADGDYAIPHGRTLDGEYVAIPLAMEEIVLPVAPSGALWSNVDDMARYLMTELADGTAPDGTTVVSAENLQHTWEPQVPISADMSYGLGWFVESYKGQPMVHHGGATAGFSSDLAFLPEADIGIVVLTNGQGAGLFAQAVRYRLLELIFEQEQEYHAQVEAILAGEAAGPALDTGALAPAATPEGEAQEADPADVEPFTGAYENEALGQIVLEVDGGTLLLDAGGEFRFTLREVSDAPAGVMGYLLADPPIAGLPLELRADDAGEATVVLGEGAVEYIFSRVAASGATPADVPAATPAAAD